MPFTLLTSLEFSKQLEALRRDKGCIRQFKAVSKCVRLLAQNPRHPGLHTHEFTSLRGPQGEKVYEAYAQNRTPGAYRVFWWYGPEDGQITLLAVTPHP